MIIRETRKDELEQVKDMMHKSIVNTKGINLHLGYALRCYYTLERLNEFDHLYVTIDDSKILGCIARSKIESSGRSGERISAMYAVGSPFTRARTCHNLYMHVIENAINDGVDYLEGESLNSASKFVSGLPLAQSLAKKTRTIKDMKTGVTPVYINLKTKDITTLF